jgi:hypothetical protein
VSRANLQDIVVEKSFQGFSSEVLNQFSCERVSEVVKLFKIQGIPLEFYKFWFYGFHSRAKGDEEAMSRSVWGPNSMKSIVQRLGFCYHKVVPFQG